MGPLGSMKRRTYHHSYLHKLSREAASAGMTSPSGWPRRQGPQKHDQKRRLANFAGALVPGLGFLLKGIDRRVQVPGREVARFRSLSVIGINHRVNLAAHTGLLRPPEGPAASDCHACREAGTPVQGVRDSPTDRGVDGPAAPGARQHCDRLFRCTRPCAGSAPGGRFVDPFWFRQERTGPGRAHAEKADRDRKRAMRNCFQALSFFRSAAAACSGCPAHISVWGERAAWLPEKPRNGGTGAAIRRVMISPPFIEQRTGGC
jgi:hypothetical protein